MKPILLVLCLFSVSIVNAQFWRTNNYGLYPNYGNYYYGNGYGNGYNMGYGNGYGNMYPYGNNYYYGNGYRNSFSSSYSSPSDTEIFGFGRRFGHTDRVGGNAGLGYACLAGCKNAVFGR